MLNIMGMIMKRHFILIMFFLAVLTVLFVQGVEARSINYNISTEIIDDKALVNNVISDISGFEELELRLPGDAKLLDISAQTYDFEKDGKTLLSVKADADNADKELRFEYLTKEFIEKTRKSYFIADFQIPFDVENFELRIVLPEGAILDAPNSAFPSPTITSDGVHIILDWQKQDLKKGESFPIFVIYREKAVFSTWLLLIPLILLLAVFVAFALKRKKQVKSRKAKKPRKVKIEAKKELHLLDSESAVIAALRKSKGEAWQKQIQIQTGFSKAKLSRVIRNLEARGIVKRIPIGNTNKIRLLIKH